VLATGPADDVDSCAYLFLQAINAARKRLWIASAYCVPDEAISHALRLAALRGADVRIMLRSTIDHVMVYHATLSYFPEMVQAKVPMFRYMPEFQHQIVLLMDDELACIGADVCRLFAPVLRESAAQVVGLLHAKKCFAH
jgi:cardiolipin synthase